MNKQSGSVSVVLAIVFSVLFIAASVFGAWAFTERQTFKNDSDRLVQEAVELAVQEKENELEAQFIEREKSPFKAYVGPDTYGSITFDYPKTWSIYSNRTSTSIDIDLYASPGVVAGVDNKEVYAFRLELLNKAYDSEVEYWQRQVDKGTMTAKAFRPKIVDNVLGVRLEGEISKDKKGTIIVLPLRDKTLKLSTEATQFTGDFNTILDTLSFIP